MNYDPKVEVLQCTHEPMVLVANVATQTMHQDLQLVNRPEALCRRLYTSKHLSVFEHAFITMRITGVSRSLMAEFTRHRHLSFTCSSQHYQDYSGYEWYCFPPCEPYCAAALEQYKHLLQTTDLPVHEARQILPNAMAVNMVVSGNARAWMEFLPKRLCHRNINEMVIAAREIRMALIDWLPTFQFVGPSCEEIGICFEGKMSCGRVEEVR